MESSPSAQRASIQIPLVQSKTGCICHIYLVTTSEVSHDSHPFTSLPAYWSGDTLISSSHSGSLVKKQMIVGK